ncbi:MAG: hypothetical protein LBU67_08325 [Oscillospiraceae bacterium]|jgi:hypothetical protein|nr:hypothetical protein [Oscillospiraceae bacterium]
MALFQNQVDLAVAPEQALPFCPALNQGQSGITPAGRDAVRLAPGLYRADVYLWLRDAAQAGLFLDGDTAPGAAWYAPYPGPLHGAALLDTRTRTQDALLTLRNTGNEALLTAPYDDMAVNVSLMLMRLA